MRKVQHKKDSCFDGCDLGFIYKLDEADSDKRIKFQCSKCLRKYLIIYGFEEFNGGDVFWAKLECQTKTERSKEHNDHFSIIYKEDEGVSSLDGAKEEIKKYCLEEGIEFDEDEFNKMMNEAYERFKKDITDEI